MSNNNYQNFIYLFNNENFINIKQQYTVQFGGAPMTSSPYELGEDFNSAILIPSFVSEGSLVFSPESAIDYRDYPRKNTSTPRDKMESIGRTILKNKSLPGPPLPMISNDPFHSPYKRVLFNLDNNSLTLERLKPNGTDNATRFTFRFANDDASPFQGLAINLPVILEESVEETVAPILANYGIYTPEGFSNYLNPELSVVNPNEFLYTQEITLVFVAGGDLESQNIDTTATSNLEQFLNHGNSRPTDDNLYLKPFSVQDISTMIGVPYDFDTVLKNQNTKKIGITTLQPKCEKVYNYYDPQYEPLTIALLDQDVIDERSLPSIYDFLFLEEEFNSVMTFLGLPGLDPEDINFSNVNQYLDHFVNVYAEYLELEVDGVTIEGLTGESGYFDDNKNLTITPDFATTTAEDLLSINNQIIENSKINWTDVTLVLKQSPLLVELITDIKQQGTPLWMQTLKTGIYFSENSIKTFNQTLDKDSVFPFLVKVNIPTETRGVLGDLFSESDILDSFNTYAASLTIPNDATPSTVDDFYGGVVNGDANEHYNLFSEAKMTTFKMHLENTPPVPNQEDADQLSQILKEDDETSQNIFKGISELNDLNIASPEYDNKLDDLIDEGIFIPSNEEDGEGSLQNLLVVGSGLGMAVPAGGDGTAAFKEEINKVIDLFQKMLKYKKDYGVDLYLDSLFSVGDDTLKSVFEYKTKDLDVTTELSSLLSQLKSINFRNKLKDLLIEKKLLRTPVDVQNGKFAHQETLMYEIAKYDFDEEGNDRFIQSVFLPITQEPELTYYDTQVIPYKDYHYRIFAHKVIVGTEYKFVKYSNDNVIESAGGGYAAEVEGGIVNFYKAKYEVKPYLQFVRVPYYNTALVNTSIDKIDITRVEDRPPIPPQVNFVPYRGVNNKILVLLNNSMGELKAAPVVMFEEDKEIIKNIATAQDKQITFRDVSNSVIGYSATIAEGDTLEYKSDDQEGTFQAYRINNKPRSYADFERDSSLKVFELDIQRNFKNDSFLDDIAPNTDYYYTFRFEDIHGKISNPTLVYKVRMEQPSANAPYLKISMIDLQDELVKTLNQKYVDSKKMQKYIMIKPSENQNNVVYKTSIVGEELDYDEDGAPTNTNINYENVNVQIGANERSVFGRKFKLRMTSKQTGKKIDVNFTVKQPKEVVNETGNIQFEKT